MIKYARVFLFIIHAGPVFFSCKTTKKVIVTAPHPVKLKGEEVITLFDSVVQHQFDFNLLSAKVSVDYTDKSGETNSFDVNLRMRKDSAIWLSVTPLLGIEAARVILTKDSIRILDRVHKTYSEYDYSFLENMLRNKINFEMIQAVIIGNYFPYLKNEKLKSSYEEEPYFILSTLNKHKSKRVQEEKDPNKPIIQDFWIDGNYRIAKSKITDDKLDRYVEANYKNFVAVDEKLFPSNMVVTISSTTPIIIKLEYNKVVREDMLTFPFTVPEKYERTARE